MPDPADSPRKPVVLAVDDDPRIRKLVELYLTKNGYQVAFAGGGDEALEKVKASKPDLILLDVMMPGMNGYEVCSRLQEDEETAYIPVIFVTALGEEADKAKAFAVGAVDYLVKPFQKETLIERVGKHLKTNRRWKEMSRAGEAKPSAAMEDDKALAADIRQFKAYLAKQLRREPEDAAIGALMSQNLYSRCPGLGLKSREMAQHIADFLSLPYLDHINPKDILLGVLPTPFCKSNSMVAVSSPTANVAFALSNPFEFFLRDMLRRFSEQGQVYRLVITEPESIAWIFKCQEASLTGKPRREASLVVVSSQEGDGAAGEAEASEDVAGKAEAAPVIRLANSLLARAIQAGASDIHIEPRENSLGVRYRIDGILHEQDAVPKQLQLALVSRLKIMTKMDIAERRVPQDGSARIFYLGRNVDLRFSTLPSRYGEKVVIRVLDRSAVALDFDSLGFEENALRIIRDSIRKPYGILLITGPTGSGKTTTLYTALQALNQPDTNIVTVEDPIEYDLHRITQVQVQPEAGLTFPLALRAILRQDPDVIMVGEIRDAETLDVAIKAALTGHLVLSTLHTNDAPGTVARLRDMADPYLVAASLQMVVAQRLLRKLCPECKKPADVPAGALERFGAKNDPQTQFYQPAGCDACGKTGYKGRLSAAEVMVVDEEMRRLIARSADIGTLRSHALEKCGMIPLRQDALAKASRGLTSLEEVVRATG